MARITGYYALLGVAVAVALALSPGLAADFAQRHGVAKHYTDADALINDPDVDAVYVASPPSSHLELALKVGGWVADTRHQTCCYVHV